MDYLHVQPRTLARIMLAHNDSIVNGMSAKEGTSHYA